MVQGFFREIQAALPKETRNGRARKAIGRFIREYAWLGKLGSVAGIDAESAMKGIAEVVEGDTSLSAQHEEVAAALRATGQPILLLLDDLDRLAPAELLLVFKLVRYVGRLPFIYYVLSYDEQTLLDVITRTDLCSNDRRRARDYLEKIIQIRLDLPPLRYAQASHLFRQGIESVAAAHGCVLGEAENKRLAEAYADHIADRLTTPRAINRYVIQLDALYPLVADEVDFVDFAVVSFIRTFEPKLYGALARLKNTLAASRGQVPMYNDQNDYQARWLETIIDAGVAESDADGMFRLLALLFPVVAGSVRQPAGADEVAANGGVSRELVEAAARRKGIGHTDYFDRYFAFAVSVDRDLSDAEVSRLLQAMTREDIEPTDVTRLASWLRDNTSRAIRKMTSKRVLSPAGTDALLGFLAHTFDALSDDDVGYENQRRSVQRAAATLLAEDPGRSPDRLRALAADERASSLLVARLAADSKVPLRVEARAAVSDRIRADLSRRTGEPFGKTTPDDRNLIFVWEQIDKASVKSFLRYECARSAWDLADVVAWVLGSGSNEIDRVERFIGVQYALTTIGEGAATADGRTEFREAVLRQLRQVGAQAG